MTSDTTYTCEVCHTEMLRTDDLARYGESDNRPDPNDPNAYLHEIIFLCKNCVDRGFHLQNGVVRIYEGSPAHQVGFDRPLVTGSQVRYNPFRMDSWPKATHAGSLSREYALRGYYRNKRSNHAKRYH